MVLAALVRPVLSFPFLLFLLSSVAPNIVNAQQPSSSICHDVHLFLARGRGEPYPGRIGAIVDSTCGGLNGVTCDYEDIAFTSVEGSEYCVSIDEGVANGVSQMQSYHARCPNSKLVLAGYSEGAHIVSDILGGGGGAFYDCVESYGGGLSPTSGPGSSVAAAVIFGNPRHTASQSYNVGSGSGAEGQYPKSGSQLASLNAFAPNLQDYCITTDPICALGLDGLSHTTYMQLFAPQAGAWVVSMVSTNAASGSAALAQKAAAASSSSAAAASASQASASKAAASFAAAAVSASSAASVAAAAASSASGASASISAASAASVASAAASKASAQVASASMASVSLVSASSASVAASASAASQLSASLASKTKTTTFAYPSDVGPTRVTSKPTAQASITSAGVEGAATTTAASTTSSNAASRPTDARWIGGLAMAIMLPLALH